MAELDERVQWLHERLTCPWPYGDTPAPDWVMETMRAVIARDGEREERIRGLEAENAELREQFEVAQSKVCTPRNCFAVRRMDELQVENAELREQLKGVALKAADRNDWQEVCQKALVREGRLQERLDRLEGRLRGRFHDDMACGACGGPLDACRDAICCQCSPEPEVLTAMARLRRAEGILAERDRQDAKWGRDQGKTPWEWLAVIVEEVGELGQALLRRKFGSDEAPEQDWREAWRQEATQVAASALAMIEQTPGARLPEGGTTNGATG